jgi:hypothetical protein
VVGLGIEVACLVDDSYGPTVSGPIESRKALKISKADSVSEAVGIILPLQFIPGLRAKNPALHRWIGRLLIPAVSLGNVGGMMATRHSFGGTIIAQTSFGTLLVISSFALFKAWVSIRAGRVHRHRVWMLRAWSYICSVSNRLGGPRQRKMKRRERKLMSIGPHVEVTDGCLLVLACLYLPGSL